jgi:hypothetical protein
MVYFLGGHYGLDIHSFLRLGTMHRRCLASVQGFLSIVKPLETNMMWNLNIVSRLLSTAACDPDCRFGCSARCCSGKTEWIIGSYRYLENGDKKKNSLKKGSITEIIKMRADRTNSYRSLEYTNSHYYESLEGLLGQNLKVAKFLLRIY